MLPRGIRNNNPLNIRRSKDQENGITSIDWFAMLKGWEMARNMSRDNP